MDQSNNDTSNIEIQTSANVKRLLIDTKINTFKANDQYNQKVTLYQMVIW